MPIATVDIRNIQGTQAALGWAGSHTLVIDRPEGRAGGMGLGFNGAQLLGLTVGGCFANDLRYVAYQMGVEVGDIAISVDVALEGDPIIATSATMRVNVTMADGSAPAPVIAQAKAISMAMNSLTRGVPITLAG